MSKTPAFSVLIPSYNRPELIGAAVASVLASTYEDFELVISDDRSPRQSEIAAVLAPFQADPRVRVHLQPENLREAANREFLFRQARAEWQIILCDDDKLYPFALATLASAIRRAPEADLHAFGYTIFDEHDRVSYSRRAPRELTISLATRELAAEVLWSDAFPFWCYHPATFCSHRRVRDSIKPNPNVGIGDDLMFLIDYINAGGTIHIVPAVLMYYRKISGTNDSLQMNQSAGVLPNLVSRARILGHLATRADLHPAVDSLVHTQRFRTRFLHDHVTWARADPGAVLADATLPTAWAEELRDHVHTHTGRRYRAWLALRRLAFFFSTFGPAGLPELASVALKRAFHRVA